MRYRALGPITVEVDGTEAKLGGLRQQMVLAVLLTHVNQVVGQDGLIDLVWAGEPPEAARATLQSYIYNLRRVLGSDAIARRGDGYLIQGDPACFDILAFEESVDHGRQALESEPHRARATLLGGLELWFGAPYGGVDHPELYSEIQRLGELRIQAIEYRIQADLALGRSGELVGELEALVREHPLRERFWGQLMVALYRSGRQAEALRAFQQARTHLVTELGIEPGTELKLLEESVLAQAPSLMADPSGVRNGNGSAHASLQSEPTGSPPATVRGYELRQVIGADEHGLTHRAFQPSIEREVAVRVIRPEHANDLDFVARFEREAKAIAALEHPHILPLYDYWRDPSGAYLVTPLMRGGNLDQSLQTGGWGLGPALRLVDQVGEALAYAHRRGVLHGSLTSRDVLLDGEGNAYLFDFGIGLLGGSHHPQHPDLPFTEPTTVTDICLLGGLTFHLLAGVTLAGSGAHPDLAGARPDIPSEVVRVIEQALAPDTRPGFGRVTDFLRELRRAAGVDVIPGPDVGKTESEPIRNPYKGLRAFSEEDAVDFHGRATLIDELMERVSSHRLLMVVGPSGSGKSSLVRAGLLPGLRAGGLPGSREWLVTDMFPGSYPFEELEAALSRVAVSGAAGIMSELTEPNGLLRVSKQILPGDDSTLLILIDQFEELFSTVRSETTRRRFLDNLVAVADDERGRVRVVMTMRADFLDRPLAYGDFAEAARPGLITVGPPTRDGLAQAVAAPARSVGLGFEPGLVGRIVGEVEGQSGALPILQYALTEMFAHREGSVMTTDDYEAIGGVTGAVGRRAEELYQGLTPTGMEAARDVFLRLVTVDEGGLVARRRARQREFASQGPDRSGPDLVLNTFAASRLLTFDRDPITRGPTVEVAHEALLTEWPRLAAWIDEARESLVLSRRIGESTLEWIDSGRDPSYLLRGSHLEDIDTWKSHAGLGLLASDELEYVAAGVEVRDTDRRTARRRRRRAITLLAGGLIVMSVLAVVAFVQRNSAQHEALQARVRELASASARELPQNPELALLIAVEAFDESVRGGAEPMTEASAAMATAVSDWRLAERFPTNEWAVPVASRDGSLVAVPAEGAIADLVIYDVEGTPVATISGPEPDVLVGVAEFSPTADAIAVTYIDGSGRRPQPVSEPTPDVVIHDIATSNVLLELDIDQVGMGVSYNDTGDLLSVSGTGGVRVFELPSGKEVVRFDTEAPVWNSAFADHDTLLVPIEGVGLATFSITDNAVLGMTPIEDLQLAASFDSTRARMAYRSGDQIQVMDLASGVVLYRTDAPGALAVALDHDGSRVAYSGFDPVIYLASVEDGTPGIQLAGILANVHQLQFVGTDYLLSSGDDALIWDVSSTAIDELEGVPLVKPQWGFEVSPDDALLTYYMARNQGAPITDPGDGLRVIDLRNEEEILVVEEEMMTIDAGVRQLSAGYTMLGSLNQDGASSTRTFPGWNVVRRFADCRSPLAVDPNDHLVLLTGWGCLDDPPPDAADQSDVVDLETGAIVLSIPYQHIYSAAFNPEGFAEGGRYLIATDQPTAQIWDVAEQELMATLDANDWAGWGNILNVAFDPTGRYVAGGTTGGIVWVLDLQRIMAGEAVSDALVFVRQAHTGAAPVPAISASGLVATSGFDGLVRIWDLETGNMALEFASDLGIPVVKFSPDARQILYPHGLSIRRMPTDATELRALAGELLTRDFSPDECVLYAPSERCEDVATGS